ncbi:uncharacterized protein NECHADRAFT_88490 [Fusarium vanettenii 77-13-4]|uniref:Uncharacterized protein n=1 Tax=Fusarium vanettenii (strain ATCC MYA-4622 / CBS 123669 / FGSC 9596 / NRRL 45880 / 77-13-4) TaxID=660122 RepID=C7ZBQ2_FUSV7|nr:uncharacterized protein NECHADRAFT_88490 [Fusarium vanettenii 77-13-4]EEU38556.1 predicted protein [Fusarium vanettenii 77-13-4]
MARTQVEPCPMNSQPAQPQSMACRSVTATGWKYRPFGVKNGQQQIPAPRNGVASPPIHGPAGMVSKTGFHWGDHRPAIYTRQQPEHHSNLASLPTWPVYPADLEVQRQNQGEIYRMSWYGASPAAAGGTSWPQQAQQSSPTTTALCLPGTSNQMPPPLTGDLSGTNRITAGDQAEKKPGPAARPTRVAYPHQRGMMSIWRAKNRPGSQPQAKSRLRHVTHSKDTNENQASGVPNRTDRVSKVPFNRERRLNQAGPGTAFPAGLERVVMELPPIRECFPDVFGNIDCASANR